MANLKRRLNALQPFVQRLASGIAYSQVQAAEERLSSGEWHEPTSMSS